MAKKKAAEAAEPVTLLKAEIGNPVDAETLAEVDADAVVTQETEEPSVVAESTPVEAEARIYIGPTMRGLATSTIFTGDLSPSLAKAIAAEPAIGELVVNVSNLRAAKTELAKRGSALYRCYERALKYRKEA